MFGVEGVHPLCFVQSHLAHIWGTCSKGYASSGRPLNITSTGFSHVPLQVSALFPFPRPLQDYLVLQIWSMYRAGLILQCVCSIKSLKGSLIYEM